MNELNELLMLDGHGGVYDPINYQYFHQLLHKRTIIMNQDIEESLIECVYMPLRDFEEDDTSNAVRLILNSSGGSVSDGFFLADYIAVYKKPLEIYTLGYAASMAAIILCAGGNNPNVTRYCYPSTYALIHDGYIALSSSETKTAEDIMNYNKKVDKMIRDFIIKNTKITPELYDKKTRQQWFLDSQEMLEYGLVDKIIGVDTK